MLDLKPHQQEALKKLDNGKILWGGVGVGKSRVAVAYYLAREDPRDVVVITTAKKRDNLDWNDEFAKAGIGTREGATLGGVLTVDSWNNIHKYTDREGCFFIFDEQRLVGSGAWVKAFLSIARGNRWIMLSATPGDTWLDYVPVFIANGFYRNRTQFKREHVVYVAHVRFPKVDRYLGEQKLERLRSQLLVHMPYEKTTVRVQKTIFVDYDNDLIKEVVRTRWNPYKHQPIRDVAELCLVMRMITNSNPSRLQAVRQTLAKHHKLIVFYSFDYELEALRSLYKLAAMAEWNGHKHEEIPKAGSWLYLVQYTAGAEAWDCVETDAMLFYSLTYSYKLWEQAHGRIDRMNTSFLNLYYYVLRSRSPIDKAIWRSLNAKKTFQPKQFSDLTENDGSRNA